MNDMICVGVPARNEPLLAGTIKDIFSKAARPERVEVMVVLDGWDRDLEALAEVMTLPATFPGVRILRRREPGGVRRAFNDICRETTCKYVWKLDAHVRVSPRWDEVFITTLQAQGEETLCIPRICGWNPDTGEIGNRYFDFLYIDSDIHQRHWPEYQKRPEAQGPAPELMSNLGASWFCTRDFWWAIGGHDESLYLWGESAPETSLKCWLSGGRQILVKDVWFAHYFRNRFPYHMSAGGIQRNKQATKEFWLGGHYPQQKRSLAWLLDKFWPVPTWPESYRRGT
jgi:glycosyltransferase involved in cell wall biosynthesis